MHFCVSGPVAKLSAIVLCLEGCKLHTIRPIATSSKPACVFPVPDLMQGYVHVHVCIQLTVQGFF